MYLDLLALTGLNAGKKQFIMSRQEEIHFYVNSSNFTTKQKNYKTFRFKTDMRIHLYNYQVRISSSSSLFLVTLLLQHFCL